MNAARAASARASRAPSPRAADAATAVILALALALLGAVVWLHVSGRLPAYALMGDLRSMVELPIYAAWVSDAGILLWWSGASVAAFAALALGWGARPGAARYLLASAALTALLALDDAFLLHEEVFPALTGWPQTGVYAAYAALTLAWLWRWHREMRAGHPVLLGAALALFAASVGLDALPGDLRPWGELHTVLEDGAKWLGIVLWTVWAWRTALTELARAAPREVAPPTTAPRPG